ncbi:MULTISPECIES: winged helix-turn-helix domain-containing protein [unclassified Streptomyces]|uniref:helix-turn-helix domain-containing protein n=1 Tax=unclassified Streptomyces TaxID=2593676 RepID=UPI001CBC757F|nr:MULTISPECIES: winged helix-turn-helix domain-containing protein [unclassified Streptomyces]WPO69159.1 winged helix-turn-helix domain-containing protein [Streptomyces sp. KN37]
MGTRDRRGGELCDAQIPKPGEIRAPQVVTRATGVVLSRASVWRMLTGRLGWSLQRPERRAVERDESEIARWIAHEWPRIKKGP